MNDLFLKIINMSISASWLVLAVLLLRFVLKKAPKWVNVLLWGIVAVRLAFPFSIESALSLIPSAETVPMDIEMAVQPTINSGVPVINSMVNPMLSSFAPPQDVLTSANPLQIWIPIFSILWIAGIAALLLYTVVSYWRLRRKVSEAVILRDNIFQSENVASPFVLGVFRPKIYLPYNMGGQDLNHVVAHEQAHIRRRDHWWKPLGDHGHPVRRDPGRLAFLHGDLRAGTDFFGDIARKPLSVNRERRSCRNARCVRRLHDERPASPQFLFEQAHRIGETVRAERIGADKLRKLRRVMRGSHFLRLHFNQTNSLRPRAHRLPCRFTARKPRAEDCHIARHDSSFSSEASPSGISRL